MTWCEYDRDCKKYHYCNQVVHDCQHCLLVCHPGKKEFNECSKHCSDYVRHKATEKMAITHGMPTTSTSSLVQHIQNQSDSYSDMMPLVPLAATLIAIMIVLILIVMAIIVRYAHRDKQRGFLKTNMQKNDAKTWHMETYEGSVECPSKTRSPIYIGKAKHGQGPGPPFVSHSTVKMKGNKAEVSVDPESLLVHKKRLAQKSDNPKLKKQKVKKSKTPATIYLTDNPHCTSMRSQQHLHNQDVANNNRPVKELYSTNNGFASSSSQARSSLHSIVRDQKSLKNSQNLGSYNHSNTESSSQPVSWDTSQKEAEMKDVQQEVCNVISFRNVSDTRNACQNEGPTQETHVKGYYSVEETQAATNGVQFTLDATPDVNPMGYEPARKHVTPHPNRVIYDILKGIDWVQGYFSEGQSIEVYADFKYIPEEVAIKELTVRTGASPDKFHLKQSEATSYY